MTLPINTLVTKEFDLRGAFRFHSEFATAVARCLQDTPELPGPLLV